MSDSLQAHGLQHSRLPCPSLSPRVCLNSCPLSQWCHAAISFSVVRFSSYPQSFLASGSFLMIRLFASGGQSIGSSASAPSCLLLYKSNSTAVLLIFNRGLDKLMLSICYFFFRVRTFLTFKNINQIYSSIPICSLNQSCFKIAIMTLIL